MADPAQNIQTLLPVSSETIFLKNSIYFNLFFSYRLLKACPTLLAIHLKHLAQTIRILHLQLHLTLNKVDHRVHQSFIGCRHRQVSRIQSPLSKFTSRIQVQFYPNSSRRSTPWATHILSRVLQRPTIQSVHLYGQRNPRQVHSRRSLP